MEEESFEIFLLKRITVVTTGQSKEVTGSLLFVFKFLSGELPGC